MPGRSWPPASSPPRPGRRPWPSRRSSSPRRSSRVVTPFFAPVSAAPAREDVGGDRLDGGHGHGVRLPRAGDRPAPHELHARRRHALLGERLRLPSSRLLFGYGVAHLAACSAARRSSSPACSSSSVAARQRRPAAGAAGPRRPAPAHGRRAAGRRSRRSTAARGAAPQMRRGAYNRALSDRGGAVAAKPYEDVRIQGHLIDSLIVPQVMDHIMDLEGEFEVLSFEVGRTKTDISTAVLRVFGRDRGHLEEILSAIQEHGAVAVTPEDADARRRRRPTASSPTTSTRPPTWRRSCASQGEWVPRREARDGLRRARGPERGTAETVPLSDVRRGEQYVVGHHGIRVVPLERPARAAAVRVHGLRRLLARSPRRRSSTRWRACCAARRTRASSPSPWWARPWCTPARRRTTGAPGRDWATWVSSSAATPWPRTTSRRPSSARRLGISTGGGHAVRRAATSTTCAPSTPSGAAAASRPAVEQGVLTSGLMYTLREDRARPSCSPAPSATTARCPR